MRRRVYFTLGTVGGIFANRSADGHLETDRFCTCDPRRGCGRLGSLFSGAPDVLARWGIDWAYAATPPTGAVDNAGQAGSSNAAGQRVTIVALPAAAAIINDRLQAIGTGRANASVTVNPYSSGRLVEFLVESGAHVEKGQVIATLDSDTEVIAQDRAKVALQDAQAKLDRVKSLRASNAATAVAVADAEVVLANAKLALRDAELALRRRSIVAPIAGVVGILPIAAGNYVTSQSAVATLDDRSSILVEFWVPERFAAAVKIGAQLSATPIANPNKAYTGTVSAIDNHIDEASRTLLVKAKIANPADSLRAGMSFQISMKFPGDSYPGGQSAGDPVGFGRCLYLGHRGRQGQAGGPCASSSATPRLC